MTESYPITGIPTRILNVSDRPLPQPLRQEVDDWYTNKDNEIQINLFFLALLKFQKMEVPDMLSYFRVAGIHGEPGVAWDEPNDGRKSYCTHNRILFPPWHRPYLLLYEQRLYEIMLDEIKEFPTDSQDELRKHAAAWRLPYWDWATERSPPFVIPARPDYRLPLIVRMKKVQITFGQGPDKATESDIFDNPMYEFRTEEPMGDYGDYRIPSLKRGNVVYPYDIARATSRYPPKWDQTEASAQAWINGVQNNVQVDEALQKHNWYEKDSSAIGKATARIFETTQYNDFASAKYDGNGEDGGYISLEYVHNNIHNWVGGPGGHMSEIEVAAFDPIFWMHHNNIDRIFAIWQTLYSDAWFEPKDGETDESTTPLNPFHMDKNHTLYTPDLARDWFKLHYSYPELQPWLAKYYDYGKFNKELYIKDIRTQINDLYGSERKTALELRGYNSGDPFTDYVINVIYGRHALEGESYTIHFFLKDIENAKTGENGEPVTRVEIGSVYNFSRPEEGCENCRRQAAAGERSRAQVPISSTLLQELIHPSNPPSPFSAWENADVETYLTNHLEWTVTKGSGEVVPVESIPSLAIFVAKGKAIHHADPGKLSEHRGYRALRKVTSGKPGGLKPDYAF